MHLDRCEEPESDQEERPKSTKERCGEDDCCVYGKDAQKC